jgi:hypothetical protein
MSEGDRSPTPRPWPLHSGFQNSHGAAVKPVALGLAVVAFRLSSFGCVGFSGSRSPGAESVAAVRVALSRVAPGAAVLVGCAAGVDAVVRAAVPPSRLQVFSVGFAGRGAFAARSAACVRAVAAAGGCWVSFPSVPCPAGLLPATSSSRCFCGAGSGSWASLAFARGLGLPCLVFLPAGVAAPVGWGLVALGRGWWVAEGAAQLPLL